jgi:hypothetical protein
MRAAREAKPSQGPTPRESHEADAPQFGSRRRCKEAKALSTSVAWGKR